MNVLFINDSTSNPNWGDRAAAVSLRAMVSAVAGRITYTVSEDDLRLSSFSGHHLGLDSGVSNKRREIAKLFIPPLILRARRKVFQNVDRSRANRLIPDRWEDCEKAAQSVLREKRIWPVLLRAIEQADVAVIHGDGAMVGNGIIPRTDLFLGYLIKRHFAKPVIIVNHTADFDHPALLRMAEGVYPLFDDVVFRDQFSAERCQEFCAGRFAPDTAFWFEPASLEKWAPMARRPTYFDVWPDTARFDPSEPYLCIGGSSILCTAWKPGEMARDFMALVKHVASLYSGQIVLTAADKSEEVLFRIAAAELDLPMVALSTPVQQAVDILGNADAYIGGRWHPSIFALRGGTPVVALSAKTFKMQALMHSAGLSRTTFDSLNLAEGRAALGRQLLEYLEQSTQLRGSLRTWAQDQAIDSWGNVAYLRRLLENGQRPVR